MYYFSNVMKQARNKTGLSCFEVIIIVRRIPGPGIFHLVKFFVDVKFEQVSVVVMPMGVRRVTYTWAQRSVNYNMTAATNNILTDDTYQRKPVLS